MLLYKCLVPKWLQAEQPDLRPKEGKFSSEEIKQLNDSGYNIYFFPNAPSSYDETGFVKAPDIDLFSYVFADMDLKDGAYASKDAFIDRVAAYNPTMIVDSGNGVHAYWEVSHLTALDFLRLQRRISTTLKTDPAVAQICQVMRCPGTVNTKDKDNYKFCETLKSIDKTYSCEELDSMFPPITRDDEQYCQNHYDNVFNPDKKKAEVSEALPPKFGDLLLNSNEVKELWVGEVDDRSKADYRLGHIMFANGFTKEEATSVLVNTRKALERAPIHRLNYAENIVSKIWTFELQPEEKKPEPLSLSVKELLERNGDDESLKGTPIRCWKYIDNTAYGFRLGQVMGLVGGSGIGKSAIALNIFQGFAQFNPECHHFFVSLEMAATEIANRWKTLCGDNTRLHDKVHVIGNYNADGTYRHLSFKEIKEYLVTFKKETGKKLGCVVIDHIGVLNKSSKHGECEDIIKICHQMKAFAIETNTFLIMQSQAPREKAGNGDIELDKSAAYGTVFYESYCDYLVTLWQPLKSMYKAGAPTITAFKFCKIRHKNQNIDAIKEDICYRLHFNPDTGGLRELTEIEEKAFTFQFRQAENRRKEAKKSGVEDYVSARF